MFLISTASTASKNPSCPTDFHRGRPSGVVFQPGAARYRVASGDFSRSHGQSPDLTTFNKPYGSSRRKS